MVIVGEGYYTPPTLLMEERTERRRRRLLLLLLLWRFNDGAIRSWSVLKGDARRPIPGMYNVRIPRC